MIMLGNDVYLATAYLQKFKQKERHSQEPHREITRRERTNGDTVNTVALTMTLIISDK